MIIRSFGVHACPLLYKAVNFNCIIVFIAVYCLQFLLQHFIKLIVHGQLIHLCLDSSAHSKLCILHLSRCEFWLHVHRDIFVRLRSLLMQHTGRYQLSCGLISLADCTRALTLSGCLVSIQLQLDNDIFNDLVFHVVFLEVLFQPFFLH